MIIDSQGIIVRVNSKSSYFAQTRGLDYLTVFDLVKTVMISVSAAILTDQYCQ